MTHETIETGIVIPIDKPYQWTSFQTVNKVKSIIRHHLDIKKFKIGHAGTLDPLATGLLLVCVGKATKSIETLQAGEKEYTGTMVLGATTPCYDMEQAIDRYYPYEHIDAEKIEQARRLFVGEIEQVPPMFSAVKIAGQRAYEYARADDPTATITAKRVEVMSFEITGYRPGKVLDESERAALTGEGGGGKSGMRGVEMGEDGAEKGRRIEEGDSGEKSRRGGKPHLYDSPEGSVPPYLPQIDFRIRCSKGTYIRSIARDMGIAMQTGAFLASLRRESIGTFHVAEAVDFDKITERY